MFKRNVVSYHDKQTYDDREIPKDLDEYGKKYLYSSYTFNLIMRCREDDKPKLVNGNVSVRRSNINRELQGVI